MTLFLNRADDPVEEGSLFIGIAPVKAEAGQRNLGWGRGNLSDQPTLSENA